MVAAIMVEEIPDRLYKDPGPMFIREDASWATDIARQLILLYKLSLSLSCYPSLVPFNFFIHRLLGQDKSKVKVKRLIYLE